MRHLPFTLSAYLLNATAVTVDKFLLTKNIPNPLLYIFYFSAFSAFALFLLPWTKLPSLETFIIASISTVLWTAGAYFMLKALQVGLVSRVIPVIGTLIPLVLLTESVINKTITQTEILAVMVLVLGLVFLTILDWKGSITKKEIIFILLSAILFAVSYIILRQAYLKADFLTVLVWSRFIILPVSVIILLIPSLKEQVFSSASSPKRFSLFSKPGLIFIAGQAAGGSSELLITYSISLASPALVNSLQGSQYVFIFLFSLILGKKYPEVFKEKLTPISLLTKFIGILFIGAGLFLLAKN